MNTSMRTPKEEAEFLVIGFATTSKNYKAAKENALLVAAIVSEQATLWTEAANSGIHNYWKEVIEEIEKLK